MFLGVGWNEQVMAPFVEISGIRTFFDPASVRGWDRNGFFIEETGEGLEVEACEEITGDMFPDEMGKIREEVTVRVEAFNERLERASFRLWKTSPSWVAGWFLTESVPGTLSLEEADQVAVAWHTPGFKEVDEPAKPFKDIELEVGKKVFDLIHRKKMEACRVVPLAAAWFAQNGLKMAEPVQGIIWDIEE